MAKILIVVITGSPVDNHEFLAAIEKALAKNGSTGQPVRGDLR